MRKTLTFLIVLLIQVVAFAADYSVSIHFNGFVGEDFSLSVANSENLQTAMANTSSLNSSQKKGVVAFTSITDNYTEDGIKFEGWFQDSSFTTAYSFNTPYSDSYHPESIYAKWEITQKLKNKVSLLTPTNNNGVLSFPNAIVSGRVKTLTVSISGAGTIADTTGASVVDLNNTCATYKVDSAAHAQTILRSITFSGANVNSSVIKVDTDGNYTNVPETAKLAEFKGHYYLFVPETISWSAAYNRAKTMTYFGRKGYLATLSDPSEYQAIRKVSTDGAWIGATILAYSNGTKIQDEQYIAQQSGTLNYLPSFSTGTDVLKDYYWACGPEAGKVIESTLKNTATEPNAFHHTSGWITGNDILGMTYYECCIVANNGGSDVINDIVEPGWPRLVTGFFVEFGGYAEGKDPGNHMAMFSATDTFTYNHTHAWIFESTINSMFGYCKYEFCDYHSPKLQIKLLTNMFKMQGTVSPDNASYQRLNWRLTTNTDSSPVVINSVTGVVTAVKAGSNEINGLAQDESNQSATCEVTVLGPN